MESGQQLHQSVNSEPLSSEPSMAESSTSEPLSSEPLSSEPSGVESSDNSTSDRHWAEPQLNKLAEFMQTRPVMFWGGVWTAMICVAVVALSGLLSPTFSSGNPNGNRASDTAIGTSIGKTTRPAAGQPERQASRIPLWLFGAIALSCTAGSILVSKQFTQRKSPRPSKLQPKPTPRPQHKRLPPQTATHPPSHFNQSLRQSQPLSHARSRTPQSRSALRQKSSSTAPTLARWWQTLAPRPRRAAPSRSSTVLAPNRLTSTKAKANSVRPARVAVTVVPANENHPLDWSEANLADTLDLRKQRSVSSWM